MRALAIVASLVVVVAVVVVGAAPAEAAPGALTDRLAEAREHRAALRYDEALAALGAALALGAAGPDEVRAIHRETGELLAGLGRADDAEAAYRRWLVLEPAGALPPGTSPKLAAPFAAAQAWLGAHGPLAVTFVVEPGTPRRLRLVVERDDLALVAGLRVRVGATRFEARGADAQVELPPGRLDVQAAALDVHGNELAVRGGAAAPFVLEAPPPPSRPRPALVARPWVWGVAAAVLGAGGVVAGLEMRAAEDELDAIRADGGMYTVDDFDAVARRGRRWAWTANGAFAGAAACAIVGAVLWARAPGAPAAEAHGVSLAPAPDGAFGLGVAGRF